MSERTNQAVFLSYASQDADAARKICDALRAAGVEVWFDQSELRGGDAWDQKIRKQIKECVLFVPIISANTQARAEGYFRREWKLAVDRTHDIADHVAFLVPVVIDATKDAGAFVPERFREVQWTRLPAGETNAAFCAQVQSLLRGGTPTGAPEAPAAPVSGNPAPLTRTVPPVRASRVTVIGLSVALLLALAFWQFRQTREAAPQRAKPATGTTPRLGTKSIVVLPFENQSEDRDANAFFADGMHQDLITNLLSIRELRCVPRETAINYRASKKSLAEIADELGVAYVLTGTVRRSDKQVRITGTLLNPRTGDAVWSKPYDKDLTNVFAIQAELAQSIAAELKTALTPEAKKALERRPTENPAAYDLYLQQRQSRNLGRGGMTGRDEQERLLEAALALDPKFARAWGDLAWVNGLRYYFHYERAPEHFAKARAAIDQALQLAPDDPEVTLNLGYYYFYCQRDFRRATEEFEKVARLQPHAAFPRYAIADAAQRLGRWKEALAEHLALIEIDPANLDNSSKVVLAASAGRRWEVARAELRRVQLLAPQRDHSSSLANLAFHARGSTSEMETLVAGLPPEEGQIDRGRSMRAHLAAMRGDHAEIVRLDRTGLRAAAAAAALGDNSAVRVAIGSLVDQWRTELVAAPDNAWVLAQLGVAEAILGEKDPALAHVRAAVRLIPESLDATEGPGHRLSLALVYAWTGDMERALDECAHALSVPVPAATVVRANVHVMRRDSLFFPLQSDPRFEALLNDPKNNAPLF